MSEIKAETKWMPTEIESCKAIDMRLIDWFATFAPEPSKAEMDIIRLYDQNKAHHDNKYVAREDREIQCELRYKWAKAMMKAR